VARVRAHAQLPTFPDAAKRYLDLAGVHPYARRAVGQAVLDAIADPDAHKALVKAAKKALG
jgi:hypothetical protein